MAGGRPTKYNKKYCQIVLDMMKQGKSVIACCSKLNIHRDTFYEWVKEHPEFSDTYKLGMAHAETVWEGIGEKGVLGMEVKRADGATGRVHPGMYAFFMKNRFKWTDRVEQTISGDFNTTVDDISSLTPEERKKRIADLMNKANV